MKINISFEVIDEMLELSRQVKDGRLDMERLNRVLDHPDYQIEFERYNGRVSREEFIDFFSNFFSVNYEKITNRDLKTRYDNMKYLFDNIDYYKTECNKIKQFSKDIFKKQAEIAKRGLPDDLEFEEVSFIFNIGIGMSFGYPYKDYTVYDIVHLIRNETFESFLSVLSHEIHHVGISQLENTLDLDKLSLEGLFYLYFSGEGLAVKYCNNGEGNLTKRIYDSEPNLGMDLFTWKYLNDDFEDTFQTFKKHINMIRSVELSTRENLNKIFSDYWMNAYTSEQDKNEPPKLKQSRNYSLGNDIWGVIHDVFGKEKVYEVFKNPECFPDVYNEAVKKIGKDMYTI
ncbi:MAG: putative zinc dependent peptidase [Clostridiales bacterium]|jgi:hypothetical protein|nr:putative zinc dependent peptidase [Clostridiales bacterium]